MVATAAGNKVSKHLYRGDLKSCKLRMRVNSEIQCLGTKYIPLVSCMHLQLIHILALSPQLTVYLAWVLAKRIQVWNQDSFSYGMESGWCRLHCKPFSRAQLLHGVVVQGFRSSSVPVTSIIHADLSGSGPHELITLSLIH